MLDSEGSVDDSPKELKKLERLLEEEGALYQLISEF